MNTSAMAEGSATLEGGTEQVVAHVRALMERGALHPGDRLAAERNLAAEVGVSRPTARAGLRVLAAMGVVRSRHGSGTYIPGGPPALGPEPLSFLAALQEVPDATTSSGRAQRAGISRRDSHRSTRRRSSR